MRELTEGVTKIEWVGTNTPKQEFTLHVNKSGVLVDKEKMLWLSPTGEEFCWDVIDPYRYPALGSEWEFVDEGIYIGTDLVGDTATKDDKLSPVKSTGGSSKYYEITLPQWLLDKHTTNGHIMLEDLAEVMFDNDFNYVNVFKAQKRMFDLEQGRGKDGNTLEYDATKCKYYIDKQVEVFNRNKGE